MAIATVQDLVGMSRDSYDAYEDYLRIISDPPSGLICYAAGQADSQGDRFRIIEIWESQEARDAFYTDRVRPATERYLADGGTPLTEIHDVHMPLHALFCAGQPASGT